MNDYMKNRLKKKIKKSLIKNLLNPAVMFIVSIIFIIMLFFMLLVTIQGALEEGHVDERVSRMTDIRLSLFISKIADISNTYETYITDVAGNDFYEETNNELDNLILQNYTYNPSEGMKGDPEITIAYLGYEYADYIKDNDDKLMNEIYSPIILDKNFKKIRNLNLYNNLIGIEDAFKNNNGRIETHLKYLQMQCENDDIKNLYVDRSKMEEELSIDFGKSKGLVDNLLKAAREVRTYFIYKVVNPEITQFIYRADKEIKEDEERTLTYIGNNPSNAKNINYKNLNRYSDYINGQSGELNVKVPSINNVANSNKEELKNENEKLNKLVNKLYTDMEKEAIDEYINQNEMLKEKIRQEKEKAEELELSYDVDAVEVHRDISDEEEFGGYDKYLNNEIENELQNEKTKKEIIKRLTDVPVQAHNIRGQEIKNLLVRIISPYGRYKITYKKIVTRISVSSYEEYLEYGETRTISLPRVEEKFVYNCCNEYLNEEYYFKQDRTKKTLRARKRKESDIDDMVVMKKDEAVTIKVEYEVEEIEAIDVDMSYETREEEVITITSTPLVEMTSCRNSDEELKLVTTFYENVENGYLNRSDYMDWAFMEIDDKGILSFFQDYEGIPVYMGDPGGKLSIPCKQLGAIKGSCAFGMRIHPIEKKQKMHTGIDINMGNSGIGAGDNVLAAEKGKVAFSGSMGGYGLTVIIDHGGGIATLYAHNSKLLVLKDEEVNRGDKIAKVGSTGKSDGPHIHFEVRVDGMPKNPLNYF